MRRAQVSSLTSLGTALLLACGQPADTDTSDADSGDAPDAPTIDAAPMVDGMPGDLYTLEFGPVSVDPGDEDTRCATLELANEEEIKVRVMTNHLGLASHHLIVYRVSQDEPLNAVPTPCSPFAGTLSAQGATGPVMITQREEETLILPNRVAYTFAPHQRIRIEMHYINTGDETVDVTATSSFLSVDPTTIDHEASFLFIGSPDIDLPACPAQDESCQTVTTEAYFNPPPSLDDINIFALTGHTHHFGRDMQVGISNDIDGEVTPVYAPADFSWSEPETIYHAPSFQLPVDGGFRFSCEWKNTSNMPVEFGESANDEMCFFWAYYYPSVGAKVCVHTDQFAGGIDLCCPDAGEEICGELLAGLD
jgi:hypothetical protein